MAKRIDSFVWTDDEVELLLRITLEYKASKFQDNVDWESCQSKYADIMEKFLAQYPSQPTDKDFPHNGVIAKSQVTAKLKNVRAKYRQAVDTGRRSGQGRVIRIFFELCEKIWGGSHPSRCIDAGIETGDLDECAPLPSPQSSPQSRSPSIEPPADSSNSNASVENLPAPSLRPRRELLQERLNNHRGDRLKRKAATLQSDLAVEEDLRIKRRMLELMEENNRQNTESMTQISRNIASITNTIQEGFSLMRELLLSQTPQRPSGNGSTEERTVLEKAEEYGCKREKSSPPLSDVDLTLPTLEVAVGDDFEMNLEFVNHSDQRRTIDIYISGSVVYYTGVTSAEFLFRDPTVTIGPHKSVKELVTVEAKNYMKHLVEQANLNFIVTGKIKETGQIVSAMKVVTLHNPKLDIKVSGPGKVNEEMMVTVEFTNPFTFSLDGVYIRMEGPGIMPPKSKYYSLITAGSSLTWSEFFTPQRAGRSRLIATLDCPALRQVYGQVSVDIEL